MRVLLDHCMPRRFGLRLGGHGVTHASDAGMGGLSNGELLKEAGERGFDVLVTVDRSMAGQQRLGALPLAVLVVFVPRNNEATLAGLLPDIAAILGQRLRRRVYTVGDPGRRSRGRR